MDNEADFSMSNKDIRNIISDGLKRGLTPYDSLLEAGIIKHPDKDFILKTYDFSAKLIEEQ